ncbi:MAG: LysR family transcriptional regulator [Lachnospiraceae bacterium]|nr:LysR family transcriptional regulator [Lachnospiraceae bacterium]
MNVNLEYYKIFYHVATELSITGAAKRLCISQPAVSQAVKQLEQELGIELFTRRAKGVSLTRAGTLLYSYVGSGYETILAGEEQLAKMLNLEYGEVRIGASDMTLQFYLLPYLEKFHQLYPEIKVTVTNAPTPQTIDHLYQGRIDFGVVTKPLETDSQFEITAVRKIQDVFVAGDKFRYLEGKVLAYSELNELPIICLEGDTSTRRYVEHFLKQNQVAVTPEFELATSDMIVQFAVRNLGVGCVVEDFAKRQIESGELIRLKFEESIPERDMCLIIDKRSTLSVAAAKLKELLEEKAGKQTGYRIC